MFGLVALGIGTAISAFGQLTASQKQAEAARREAELRNKEADEIIARSRIRERQLIREGEQFKGQQVVAIAASGTDVGEDSALTLLADTQFKINQDLLNLRRETEFRAQQLRLGASFQAEQAGSILTAGGIGAAGTLFSGLGQSFLSADRLGLFKDTKSKA